MCCVLIRITVLEIWRLWDRASWYISIVKPTRAQFFEFIDYHSTCFGWSFRASSGVQDCTYSIRYTLCRFVDCLLASSQRTCKTYTGCFKKSFTNLKAYRNLYRGHTQRFELSKCAKHTEVYLGWLFATVSTSFFLWLLYGTSTVTVHRPGKRVLKYSRTSPR
jgi:hypothetical protein